MTHQDEMFITALGIEESSNNSRPRIRKGHIAVENLVVDYHRPEKLPESVLFPSIVEGVLREAWFIGMPGNSRLFWRQELTSKEFKNIATDGYWWCVLYDVQKKLERNSFYDSSSLDSEEQTVLERDPIFGRMASSYASIFKRICANFPPQVGGQKSKKIVVGLFLASLGSVLGLFRPFLLHF